MSELHAAIGYVVERHRGHENAATTEQIAEEVVLFFLARGREAPWSSIQEAERRVAEAISSLAADEETQIINTSNCVYVRHRNAGPAGESSCKRTPIH